MPSSEHGYRIIAYNDRAKLVEAVNNRITNGWVVLGQPFVVKGAAGHYLWNQAMVKDKE